MKNILILIDIQKEYITKNRPFYLNGINESLHNCKKILSMARDKNWEIAHVVHAKEGGKIFATNSEFTELVEGFEPIASERVFTKSLYSCYSDEAYAEYMRENKSNKIYIIGYNSIMCCLSTIIEGYHKGQNITFVQDASLAKSTKDFTEEDMHKHSVSIIETAGFAEVINTADLLE